MAGLNAILAKIYSPFAAVAGGDVSGGSQPQQQQSPTAEETDQFLPGQHWQNRAVAKIGSPVEAGFRGGNYTADVARVYASQGAEQSVVAAGQDTGAEETAQGESAKTGSAADGQVPAAGAGSSQVKGVDGQPLDMAEVAQLAELKKADTAVRAHEQAHLAAAGGLAKGGASFSYQKGPDGKNYAVAGEVQIDTSKGATPEETVAKMMRVRAAALAPANPSPQDRKVAQAASLTMSEARLELNTERVMPEGQQQETQEGAAVENAEGEAANNSAETASASPAPTSPRSSLSARAASRYLVTAKGQSGFHLAV